MKNHPVRKPNRLEGFDYSECRSYFVTICTKNRENFFGTIDENQMKLSEVGRIAEKKWKDIHGYFQDVELGEHIVMPNHIHGIITILGNDENEPEGERNNGVELGDRGELRNRQACSLQNCRTHNSVQIRNHQKLPVIIGSFKSGVTPIVNRIPGISFFAWQKSYYDRILRNEEELAIISEYIRNNPLAWLEDEENPASGAERYNNGPERYASGPERCASGAERYGNGPERYASGPERYDNGPERYATGPERYDNGTER